MTMRQYMTWVQVSYLWGNGGMVKGEVGCGSLSEEEHMLQSDATV
jgi:hypothetical protein